jgi:hypothetical protein
MDLDSQSKRGLYYKILLHFAGTFMATKRKVDTVFDLKVLAPPKTLRFIYEHFVYTETGLLHSSDGIKKWSNRCRIQPPLP